MYSIYQIMKSYIYSHVTKSKLQYEHKVAITITTQCVMTIGASSHHMDVDQDVTASTLISQNFGCIQRCIEETVINNKLIIN